MDAESVLSNRMNWVLAKLNTSSSQDSALAQGQHQNLLSFGNQLLALEERRGFLFLCVAPGRLTSISSEHSPHVVEASLCFKRKNGST